MREEFEFFTVDHKKRKYEQHHTINDILFANVFPDGPFLQEEAKLIKERLNNTNSFQPRTAGLKSGNFHIN